MNREIEQDGCILIDSDEEEERERGRKRGRGRNTDGDDLEEILDFVDSKNWYSVAIEDPQRHSKFHSKENILAGLLESITPVEFVPVLVESGDRGVMKIYATQCEKAIMKISSLGFQFYCRNDLTNPIRVKVSHNDPPPKKVNPLKIIHDCISLRFTKSINKLDLAELQNDFMLRGKIFFPLWYPGNQKLITILIKALSLTPAIHILNLSQNALTNISSFNIPTVFSNIHTLNLSNNNLKSFEVLRHLQGSCDNITCLNLDGNDLCLDFIGERNYITCTKMIFPSLTKLDNRVLYTGGLPGIRRNFTVNWDSVPLVDKLMETYFTLFDSNERNMLCAMYSPNAVLTISGSGQANGIIPGKRCRNLLDPHSATVSHSKVFVGTRRVMGCINSFPQTLHDPFSFHVDIVTHSSVWTVLHIKGVFKVPASNVSEEEPMMEFTRTFIISSVGSPSSTYQICNDMISFMSASPDTCKEAFKHVPVMHNKLSLDGIEKYLSETVMKGIIEIFIHLTEFPHSEAKACLERNKWNLRAALVDALSSIDIERVVF